MDGFGETKGGIWMYKTEVLDSFYSVQKYLCKIKNFAFRMFENLYD